MGKYGGQHRGKAVGGAAKSTNPFLGLLDDLLQKVILHPVFRRCWGCLLNILEGLRALADIISTKKMKSVDTNWAPAK